MKIATSFQVIQCVIVRVCSFRHDYVANIQQRIKYVKQRIQPRMSLTS